MMNDEFNDNATADENTARTRAEERALRLAAQVKARQQASTPPNNDDDRSLEKSPEAKPRRDFSHVTDERTRRAIERSESIRLRKEQRERETHYSHKQGRGGWEREM